VCDSEEDFTADNSARLEENCVWDTTEFYPTFKYYVRIVANNPVGNTTSEFQFDALKSGSDGNDVGLLMRLLLLV